MPDGSLASSESDVIGILDSTGTLVVQYSYDAWGKILSVTDGDGVAITNKSHVAYLNPIRYRGYVYDEEIGMYYLQSRYYDPTTGRFINQDMAEIILEDQGFLGQYNLYAYCGNNPVNCIDLMGYLSASVMRLVGGISAAAIFSRYAAGLYTAFAATITKISVYVTGVLLPKITALFWWQPWLVAGIVVAAVAIVIASVKIYTNNRIAKINNDNMNKTVAEILKSKKGSIKNAPLPPGGPHWNDILKKTLKEIKSLAQKGKKGYKEIYKLLTDARFNR